MPLPFDMSASHLRDLLQEPLKLIFPFLRKSKGGSAVAPPQGVDYDVADLDTFPGEPTRVRATEHGWLEFQGDFTGVIVHYPRGGGAPFGITPGEKLPIGPDYGVDLYSDGSAAATLPISVLAWDFGGGIMRAPRQMNVVVVKVPAGVGIPNKTAPGVSVLALITGAQIVPSSSQVKRMRLFTSPNNTNEVYFGKTQALAVAALAGGLIPAAPVQGVPLSPTGEIEWLVGSGNVWVASASNTLNVVFVLEDFYT